MTKTDANSNRGPADLAEATWWDGPAGGRDVLRLALPLVVSSLSWTVLTFVDRMFLAWWSHDALAASFPAALLWWTSLCFPMGIAIYVGTFVSQYHGSNSHVWIGPIVWQGVWICLFATPIVFASLPIAAIVFDASGHEPAVIANEWAYFRILCIGSPAMLVAHAFSSFFSGRGRTSIVMVIDSGMTLVNVALDYCWIFGYCRFPAAGIEGAAWATIVSLWLRVLVYLVLILHPSNRGMFHTHEWRPQRRLMGRLAYYGGPSGLQMFLEVVGFTAFVMLVGSLGVIELAATNLAFNVSSVAFMPVFGLSTAVSILVGQYVGSGRIELAERSTWTTVRLALIYMGVISALYCLVPDLFLFGFFTRSNDPSERTIRAIAVVLLRYVAAYNLFDGMNLVFAHAVKGAGDTHFVFWVSFTMAAVLALATWIAVRVLEWGLHGSWCLVTAWIAALGCVYWARFHHGAWRTMRVIEATPRPSDASVPPTDEAKPQSSPR
ncbi:MAG: MATE family efflux transporter [Planctomycetes bacterium]|nr:MATE family efflux transporter [Planctomycetota bacterium]